MPALHRLYTFLNQYNASSTSLSTCFKRLQSRRKIPKLTTHRMDSELLSRTVLLRNTLLQELVITGLLTSTSFPNSNRYQISSWEKNSPSYQELNVTQKHGGICTQGLGLKQMKETTNWNSRIFQQHNGERKPQAALQGIRLHGSL